MIAASTAGAYSLTSSHSISFRLRKKYVAMNTKAGAVANAGMLCANGAKNKHNANNTATVTAVSPVLPPSLIPAPDSMYDVVFEVPANAPTTGLRYYCVAHGESMGNTITTANNDLGAVAAIGASNLNTVATNAESTAIVMGIALG